MDNVVKIRRSDVQDSLRCIRIDEGFPFYLVNFRRYAVTTECVL